jgi:exodeoxyribonuclease VII large subunit
VVTSPAGAALRDFLRVLHDRFPIPVLIAPARVQGEGAAEEIARGVARLNRAGVDVVVVTRGGGSIEDLWAFNEEVVARAIAASKAPVVSAVGHEVDHTIADFVADLRCATPTDAAKTLAPCARRPLAPALRAPPAPAADGPAADRAPARAPAGARRAAGRPPAARGRGAAAPRRRRGPAAQGAGAGGGAAARAARRAGGAAAPRAPPVRLGRASKALSACGQALARAQRARLSAERARLGLLGRRLQAASPAPAVARGHRALGALRERADKAMARRLAAERVRLSKAAARLEPLSPLQVLSRGYRWPSARTGAWSRRRPRLRSGPGSPSCSPTAASSRPG